VSVLTLAALAGLPFGASAADDPLQAVFARIDKTSLTFRWMTAKVQKTEYVAVIDETSTENGKILVLKPKPSSTSTCSSACRRVTGGGNSPTIVEHAPV